MRLIGHAWATSLFVPNDKELRLVVYRPTLISRRVTAP
jgi:hypothetical protein